MQKAATHHCGSESRQCGTKRPDAHAAIADAAFPRSGGRFYAALRLASWKRPFKATISADSRPTFRRVMFELTHRGTKRAFAARAPKTASSISSKGQNDQTGRLFIRTRIINFSRGINFRKVVQGPVTQRIDGLAE
jgi:hypothetical protein